MPIVRAFTAPHKAPRNADIRVVVKTAKSYSRLMRAIGWMFIGKRSAQHRRSRCGVS